MALANRQTARVRALVGGSATATLIGIAFAAAGEQTLGGWICVLSLVCLIYGVHKLGRLGADELVFDGPRRAPRRDEDD